MADHLFAISRADIFEIYPRILTEILLSEELAKVRASAKERVIDLPSDFEWQLKMYFRLLEHQKQINQAVEQGMWVVWKITCDVTEGFAKQILDLFTTYM